MNATVSSTDLRHKAAAPTFPPVTGRTAYKREQASRNFVSVGVGVAPFRERRQNAESWVCRARCKVGKRGMMWVRVLMDNIFECAHCQKLYAMERKYDRKATYLQFSVVVFVRQS